MWNDFKAFVMRGNVLDLAVAVIIGGAFGAIVTSLVNDIIMPLIGILTGGIDFTQLILRVGSAELKYGMFIQNVINFIIVALVIFMLIRIANRFKKPAPPPAVTTKFTGIPETGVVPLAFMTRTTIGNGSSAPGGPDCPPPLTIWSEIASLPASGVAVNPSPHPSTKARDATVSSPLTSKRARMARSPQMAT